MSNCGQVNHFCCSVEILRQSLYDGRNRRRVSLCVEVNHMDQNLWKIISYMIQLLIFWLITKAIKIRVIGSPSIFPLREELLSISSLFDQVTWFIPPFNKCALLGSLSPKTDLHDDVRQITFLWFGSFETALLCLAPSNMYRSQF